jgi:predicted DNA-binding ribbon-helix-helix protein
MPKISKSNLKSRNVVIDGRRTSLRLEDELWDALKNLAECGGQTVNQLVSELHAQETRTGTLTSAVRVHIIKSSLK